MSFFKKTLFVLLFFHAFSFYAQNTVYFKLKEFGGKKKFVGIRGNQSPLSWDKSIQMKPVKDGYEVSINFKADVQAVEYKFVTYDSEKSITWESIDNRIISLSGQSNNTIISDWNKTPKIDVDKLPKISAAQLLKEYQIIEDVILKVHPGTYRYNSEVSINNALQELKNTFSSDLSQKDVYVAISKLMAQIKCDHTFASYYNQGNILKEIIHNQKDKIPFTFKWINNKMVVTYDASKQNLPSGTEILEINSINVSSILSKLLPYAKADGSTDMSRVVQMEIDGFPYRYNGFDVMFPLLFNIKKTVNLKVLLPNERTPRELSIDLQTREERANILRQRYASFEFDKAQLWTYKNLNNKTGLITAGTFDDSGMELNWQTYFKQLFKKIKNQKIENLIIDLRNNEGGFDEIGLGLITHLIKNKGTIYDFRAKSRYKKFPESLKPYTSSWGDPWYYSMNVSTMRDKDGYYTVKDEEAETLKPAKNAFKGDVYYLVGPKNVSMAFYLVSSIKKYRLGTLIGEETGGNQLGINGGQILFLRLPYSKVEIDFPVDGVFTVDKKALDMGVVPDYVVKTTKSDIIKGRDPQLEKAISLISQKK